MACLSCIKAHKGCVYDPGSSSCQRCLRLGKKCIPKPSKKPKQRKRPKSSAVRSSKTQLPESNRMKSAPSGPTYQVDGHVTGTCHRSVQCIVTIPTCESFSDLFNLHKSKSSSPSIVQHTNALGNRWIPPKPRRGSSHSMLKAELRRKQSKTIVHHAYFDNNATPHYCYTYKSKQPSSVRTRLPALYLQQRTMLLSSLGHRHQCHQTHNKNNKIDEKVFIDVNIPTAGVRLWSKSDLKSINLVVDGGDATNSRLEKPPPQGEDDLSWFSLDVCHGDLKVADTKDASRGLVFRGSQDVQTFLRVPRKHAFQSLEWKICSQAKSFANLFVMVTMFRGPL